ncbi:MAG: hypothetical protein ACYC6T_08270 [Thermoleophilia bacterium]
MAASVAVTLGSMLALAGCTETETRLPSLLTSLAEKAKAVSDENSAALSQGLVAIEAVSDNSNATPSLETYQNEYRASGKALVEAAARLDSLEIEWQAFAQTVGALRSGAELNVDDTRALQALTAYCESLAETDGLFALGYRRMSFVLTAQAASAGISEISITTNQLEHTITGMVEGGNYPTAETLSEWENGLGTGIGLMEEMALQIRSMAETEVVDTGPLDALTETIAAENEVYTTKRRLARGLLAQDQAEIQDAFADYQTLSQTRPGGVVEMDLMVMAPLVEAAMQAADAKREEAEALRAELQHLSSSRRAAVGPFLVAWPTE